MALFNSIAEAKNQTFSKYKVKDNQGRMLNMKRKTELRRREQRKHPKIRERTSENQLLKHTVSHFPVKSDSSLNKGG